MQRQHLVSYGSTRLDLSMVLFFAMSVCLAFAGCQRQSEPSPMVDATAATAAAGNATAGLPRLVDLGAGKCIPCKMMAPILDELGQEYSGSLEVVFIDVWEDAAAGEKYGIRSIPTQIFYDPEGNELFRHEGFLAKEAIVAKWQELGFPLAKKAAGPSPAG